MHTLVYILTCMHTYIHTCIHTYIVCGSATGKDEVYWGGGRHLPPPGHCTRFIGEEKHSIHGRSNSGTYIHIRKYSLYDYQYISAYKHIYDR